MGRLPDFDWRANLTHFHRDMSPATEAKTPISSPSEPSLPTELSLLTCPPPTLKVSDQFRSGVGCWSLKGLFFLIFAFTAVIGARTGWWIWRKNRTTTKARPPEKSRLGNERKVEQFEMSTTHRKPDQKDKFPKISKVVSVEPSEGEEEVFTFPPDIWVPQKLDCEGHGVVRCKRCARAGKLRKEHRWKEVLVEAMRADSKRQARKD
ncbi:hypothetical protein RUND412_008454 [Rhizina undulata]